MHKKINILLAEDDLLTNDALSTLLIAAGYKVTSVNNGEDALKIIQEQQFETILMDLQMPEINGEQVSRTLKKYLQNKTPIIAVTAKELTTSQLMQLGISEYIQKPIDFKELSAAIQRTVATISNHRDY